MLKERCCGGVGFCVVDEVEGVGVVGEVVGSDVVDDVEGRIEREVDVPGSMGIRVVLFDGVHPGDTVN